MITFEHTPLMTAIKALKKVVPTRHPIPNLTHIKIEADSNGRAILTGTDLDSWLELTIPRSSVAPDAAPFTVSIADLEQILTSGDKGKLITILAAGGVAAVEHDGVSVQLETMPAADFPSPIFRGDAIALDIPCGTAREMLSYCAGTMSSEETRYYLHGVYFHQPGESGKLASVATDGHRLNLAKTSIPYAGGGAILPSHAVNLVLHLLAKADGDLRIDIPSDSANAFKLSGNGWNLVTEKIDGTFPDYTRIMPQGRNASGNLNCDAVAKAAAKIARITSKRGAAILDLSAGQLRHQGVDKIKGIAIDIGDTGASDESAQVGVDSAYLEQAMKQLSAFSDNCAAKIDGGIDGGKPILFEPDSIPSWAESIKSVVMPMRVQ